MGQIVKQNLVYKIETSVSPFPHVSVLLCPLMLTLSKFTFRLTLF